MTPDDVVRASLQRAERLASRRVTGDALLRLLRQADKDLSRRLNGLVEKLGGPKATFEVAQATAYRAQIRLVANYVERRMLGLTDRQARRAIGVGYADTVRLLEVFEAKFSGLAQPLKVAQAANRLLVVNRSRASLLRQHASSMKRYGDWSVRQMERVLARGLLTGSTQEQMVSEVMSRGFVSRRWAAERVIRTEVQHGYNEAAVESMVEAKRADFPDLGKKILAHFDNRTAFDSAMVHGQVRALNEPFQDGAGRVYQRPPARPNDRETVIPWRMVWPEEESTKPASAERVEAARARSDARRQPLTARKAEAVAHAVARRSAVAHKKATG